MNFLKFLRAVSAKSGKRGTDVSVRTGNLRGFTLIELLVVMSIIIMLAGLVVPATGPLLKGSQLTQSGQILSDQLAFARQRALATNRTVEVRFYQFGDPEVPGETAANPTDGKFRAMQIFDVLTSGSTVVADKVRVLQPSVIFDSGSKLSTLLNQPPPRDAQASTKLNPVPLIPRVGTSYQFAKFQFRPDGSTDLTPTSNWFLTLHNMNHGDKLDTPPANFVTVQIDPANGKVRTFRP